VCTHIHVCVHGNIIPVQVALATCTPIKSLRFHNCTRSDFGKVLVIYPLQGRGIYYNKPLSSAKCRVASCSCECEQEGGFPMGKTKTKTTKNIGDYTKAELLAELKKHEAKAKEPAKVVVCGMTGEELTYIERLPVMVNGKAIRSYVSAKAFWELHAKGRELTEKANA